MTMQEFDAATEIATSTTPICRYNNHDPDHIGSGVFLRIGTRHFVATAAHVSDKQFQSPMVPFLPTPSEDHEEIVIEEAAVIKSRLSPHNSRDDDPFDVAVFELSRPNADRVSSFSRFVNLQDIDIHGDRLPALPLGYYMFVGFPCCLGKKNPIDRIFNLHAYKYYTRLYFHEEGRPNVWVDESRDIVLNFQNPTFQYSQNDEAATIDAYGLSGCGLWRAADSSVPLNELRGADFKLIGIAHTWIPDAGVIKGVKIKYVLQMIHTHYSDLHPEIDSTFPFPTLA